MKDKFKTSNLFLIPAMLIITSGVIMINIDLEDPTIGVVLIAIGGLFFILGMRQKKREG